MKKFYIITTIPMSFVFFRGQFSVLREKYNITLISSSEPVLAEIAKQNKVNFFGITMSRDISLLADCVSFVKFFIFFLKNKPDVIHANTPKGSFLSLAAGWLCRVHTRIYFVHGLRYQGETGFKRNLLIGIEKLSCFFATNIVAVSKGLQKQIKIDNITKKEVKVIWNGSINGLDLKYFDPEDASVPNLRTSLSIGKDRFVFGFVGRLVKDKGINELVAAFHQVNKNNSATKLLLVGGFESKLDPLADNTLKMIHNHPDIVAVDFQDDVRPWLKAMDLLVFPSYREGFGLSIMEAAAMNVPAISSDIVGCNEIVEENVTGFLIPPRDEELLHKAMSFAINNKCLIAHMSQKTRKKISEKFEQNVFWSKLLKYYDDIIS